jgi:hypothetical protein
LGNFNGFTIVGDDNKLNIFAQIRQRLPEAINIGLIQHCVHFIKDAVGGGAGF